MIHVAGNFALSLVVIGIVVVVLYFMAVLTQPKPDGSCWTELQYGIRVGCVSICAGIGLLIIILWIFHRG